MNPVLGVEMYGWKVTLSSIATRDLQWRSALLITHAWFNSLPF
jgi:hypothetical protein